jgi:site-specific DNA-cytosine methylase
MRDFIQIKDASRIFGVSEQTLRNWDRAGKLKAHRHPINGYRLYRVGDLHALIDNFPAEIQPARQKNAAQLSLPLPPAKSSRFPEEEGANEMPPCHWSLSVALDPKHRPQSWDAPSSTVRRDWRKYPQEAHVIDKDGSRYRRLTPDEVAGLQCIEHKIFDGLGLTDRERIACVGDAVPPPLARAVFAGILHQRPLSLRTGIEICAGIGGLASGAMDAGIDHLALIEKSDLCGRVLRNGRAWSADAVHVGDVKSFPFRKYRGRVGIISGGPPCQPWSQSGLRQGSSDERDLLGFLPEVVADLQPEVAIFENVPGLIAFENRAYVEWLIERYRQPSKRLRYSVLIGKFDAADFGVPQHRHRIFLLAIKDGTAKDVCACFDAIAARSTHRNPGIADPVRRPWRNVGEILGERTDPGGWRRWIGTHVRP